MEGEVEHREDHERGKLECTEREREGTERQASARPLAIREACTLTTRREAPLLR